MTELINCGERRIQKLGRISILAFLESNGLKAGDVVEVFIKKKGSD